MISEPIFRRKFQYENIVFWIGCTSTTFWRNGICEAPTCIVLIGDPSGVHRELQTQLMSSKIVHLPAWKTVRKFRPENCQYEIIISQNSDFSLEKDDVGTIRTGVVIVMKFLCFYNFVFQGTLFTDEKYGFRTVVRKMYEKRKWVVTIPCECFPKMNKAPVLYRPGLPGIRFSVLFGFSASSFGHQNNSYSFVQ